MRKSTILIESITRERLKQIGRKGQSYDQLINYLIGKKKLNSVDRRIESHQSTESDHTRSVDLYEHRDIKLPS
jgi:hypothetical protein